MSTSDIIATIALVVASVSAVAAVFSVVVAYRTLRTNSLLAQSAIKVNENAFLRQNVITLREYWDRVPPIDPNNPKPPDVAKSVNALDLTASLWNHEGLEKEILYQSYWDSFRNVYDKLNNLNTPIPGLPKPPHDYLDQTIITAYQDMLQYGKVKTTTLDSKKTGRRP